MHRPSAVFPLAMVLAALTGCDATILPPELPLASAEARRPKPPPEPNVEEFDPWDPSAWVPGDHPLGKGYLDPGNVSQGAGELLLTIPGGGFDGAEVRSAGRFGYGAYEARLKTPTAPGSISAFFLYELVRKGNDEIDIEIFNDGSRRIWFTTWVADVETNHTEHLLPFDPAADYHEYRIEWTRGLVRFLVDGVVMETFTQNVPRAKMHVFANAWWPTWLSGTPPASPREMHIDRVIY